MSWFDLEPKFEGRTALMVRLEVWASLILALMLEYSRTLRTLFLIGTTMM